MNVKIECACGQRLAFEVEPENGAMPCELACPSCQTDVTGLANAEIRRQLSPVSPSAAAPTRVRVVLPASSPGLALARSLPASAPTAAPAPEPVAGPRPVRPGGVAMAAAAALPVGVEGDEASIPAFLRGTLGVLLGTLVGLGIWYLVAKAGATTRLLAILVGVGAGGGGRLFCRSGDKGLGSVAALVAVLAMFVGGAITLNKALTDKFSLSDKDLRESYDNEVKTAKEIVAEIQRGTDDEIRRYLVKRNGAGSEVTAEDVAEFRASDEFKDAKDLAGGKIPFQTYAQSYHTNFNALTGEAQKAVNAVGAVRMLSIWLIALVGGTAYKLAAG